MTERDYAYKKAAHKLTAELDIKRILSTLRLFRATLKFLTTPKQRKLLRMQAKENVIEVRPAEYESLTKPIAGKDYITLLQELKEDTDFDSEKQDDFISNLDYKPGKEPS